MNETKHTDLDRYDSQYIMHPQYISLNHWIWCEQAWGLSHFDYNCAKFQTYKVTFETWDGKISNQIIELANTDIVTFRSR